MNSKFNLTRYYKRDSFIHNFNPKLKFLTLLIFIVCASLPTGYTGIFFVFVILFPTVIIARLPAMTFLKILKPVVLILLISLIFNVFLTRPGEGEEWKVLFYIKDYPIYAKGFYVSGEIFFRTYAILLSMSIFSLTTRNTEIIESIIWFLTPLKLFKLPVNQIGLMLSFSFKFVPTVFDDLKTIHNSQVSRGINFKSAKFKEKSYSVTSYLTPLFIMIFKKSNRLSNILTVRKFDLNKKLVSYYSRRINIKDCLMLFFVFVFLGFMILLVVDKNFEIIPRFLDPNYWIKNLW